MEASRLKFSIYVSVKLSNGTAYSKKSLRMSKIDIVLAEWMNKSRNDNLPMMNFRANKFGPEFLNIPRGP